MTVNYAQPSRILGENDQYGWVFTWTFAVGDDSGNPITPFTGYIDRSIEISGSLGGGTWFWEGSNEGVTYFTLNDPFGNALTGTQLGLHGITEAVVYARPRLSGSAAPNAVFTLMARRGLR